MNVKKHILVFLFLLVFNGTNSQNIEKWDNPVLFHGSSFGHFFQQLYKQGLFGEMLKFTSEKSIKQYGQDSIVRYYKSINFGYKMKLKSRIINESKGITTLNYESDILGGKYITRLNVVVENDTCRLLLDNTVFHLGVTWMDANLNRYNQ